VEQLSQTLLFSTVRLQAAEIQLAKAKGSDSELKAATCLLQAFFETACTEAD
jgi:hypothetical protein